MSRIEIDVLGGERAGLQLRAWLGAATPVIAAAALVTVLLGVIVALSWSAWSLLGAGRGFVPEDYYPVWGFVLALATTFGQAAGWGAATALGWYVLGRLGLPSIPALKIAASAAYLALGPLPIAVYHGLFGGPLLGLPREGVRPMLQARYPDAYWLLFGVHPVIDTALIPLALVFLGIVWFTGDGALRSRPLQAGLALTVLGTALAFALSLAIHSILVHIRL